MNKYVAIYLTSLKETLQYRMELFLWSLIDAMPLIAMLALWLSVFSERSEIGGFTKSALIGYYVIGFVVQDITGSHFEENFLEKIRMGTIMSNLVKPYSVKLKWIAAELGWRTMTIFFTVLPVAIISVIYLRDSLPLSLNQGMILLPMMFAMAYIMETIYSLMIASMGFVFEEANSFSHLKWMVGWLFSGSMMPFQLMPSWLARVANVLPFKFRYFVPVQIITGKLTITQAILEIGFQLCWLTLLMFLLQLLWKRNIKLFTAVGS